MLSDAKSIDMLQKWTCLQSLLKQDLLPGKKLMKILRNNWKDCTYYNARYETATYTVRAITRHLTCLKCQIMSNAVHMP